MPATTPTSALARGPWSLPFVRRLILAGVATACLLLDTLAWSQSASLGMALLVAHLALVLYLTCLLSPKGSAPRGAALGPEELAGRMAQARDHERERLSRELHDDIGQLLTAAHLQLEWLGRRAPDTLAAPLESLRGTLAECLGKVRDVSALLSPRRLAHLGLEASLRETLTKTLSHAQINWSLECRQRLDGLPDDMALAAFRIVQEGVTNLIRHAHAQNLWVTLSREKHGLSIRIIDDGEGFDTAAAPQGRGLACMAERAQALHGQLSVRSTPGAGTRIDALLPWPARAVRPAPKGRM